MAEKKSAWVLCPSKKFPGKFYYFNTQNGNTAWSWTDSSNNKKIRNKAQASNALLSSEISSPSNIWNVPLRYKSVLQNPFSSKPAKPLKRDNGIGKPMKAKNKNAKVYQLFTKQMRASCDEVIRSKIYSQFDTAISTWDMLDNVENMSTKSILSSINNEYNTQDKMKIDINCLKKLSNSTHIDKWYIVPDIDVLLDNLDFIKEFIAGDQTCNIMTPAAVLKKLQFLSDVCCNANSCASVAINVFNWLAKHSVCEINNQDLHSLNDAAIDEQIIKFCIQMKIVHVVIITKKQQLQDTAKISGIHAYNLNDLKITKSANESLKDNIFLQYPDNFDPFFISKSVGSFNTFSNNVNNCSTENNNKIGHKNLNKPILRPSRLQIVHRPDLDKSDQRNLLEPSNIFDTLICNPNIDANLAHVNSTSKMQENQNVVKPKAQREANLFDGFNSNTNIYSDVPHVNNSSRTQDAQNLVPPNIQQGANLFSACTFNSNPRLLQFNNSSKRQDTMNALKPNAQKEGKSYEDLNFNANFSHSRLSHVNNCSRTQEISNVVDLNAYKEGNIFGNLISAQTLI